MNPTGNLDPEQDDQYVSSEDEDFNPTNVEAQDDELSESSEDEAAANAPSKARKTTKKRKQTQASLDEHLDSGDEATIRELKKKKKRKGKDGLEDQDSGGEGGLIKTRAQRKAETQEKAAFRNADQGNVTVDVDDLWAKLSSAPVGRQRRPEHPTKQETVSADGDPTHDDAGQQNGSASHDADDADEMITIKRSYGFAGQTITEEKRVHKSSAEAKLYLASNHAAEDPAKPPTPSAATGTESGLQLRRPLRRASRFEPNPTGEVKGLPLERQRLRAPSRADVMAQKQRQEDEDKRRGKVQKLNTVQKSAMDWAAHVDREGFKEELDVYGRSRHGFLDRMEFMRGVEGRKEQEERSARLATSAAAVATGANM